MGKVVLFYATASGNTAKMAEHVAAGAQRISQTDVRLRNITAASLADVKWCDGIALGAPTNMGTVPWEMKRFWDVEVQPAWAEIDGRSGCAFATQGGWSGGAELTCQTLNTILMNYGFLVFGVTDHVAQGFTLHYGATVAGEPRTDPEVEACRRLGQRLAEWVAVYVDGRREEHPLTAGRTRFPWPRD